MHVTSVIPITLKEGDLNFFTLEVLRQQLLQIYSAYMKNQPANYEEYMDSLLNDETSMDAYFSEILLLSMWTDKMEGGHKSIEDIYTWAQAKLYVRLFDAKMAARKELGD